MHSVAFIASTKTKPEVDLKGATTLEQVKNSTGRRRLFRYRPGSVEWCAAAVAVRRMGYYVLRPHCHVVRLPSGKAFWILSPPTCQIAVANLGGYKKRCPTSSLRLLSNIGLWRSDIEKPISFEQQPNLEVPKPPIDIIVVKRLQLGKHFFSYPTLPSVSHFYCNYTPGIHRVCIKNLLIQE
ncbi:hypothetical protein J6590_043269 [Homalodisca vitripennis]|nr:hypothetical protein J6590_043269 [Homalodisca vitripennis]